MPSRTLLNLGLLVLVAGLGLAVWFSQEQEEKGPPLTPLAQGAITRVSLEHPGKPAIRLEKQDAGAWHLVEPVQAPADALEMGGILSLATLELKKTLDAGIDRVPLELDPPRYAVTLDDTRIELGGSEPIQYRRYVAIGDLVGVVDDPPSAALDADFSDLIDKTIVPESAALSRIELPGLTLEKGADGAWRSPQQPDAAPAGLARLAQGWKEARAMWNAAEPESGSQGEPVRLTLDDGRTINLVVQARDPQLILARPDYRVRYTLSKVLATELFEVPAPAAENADTGIGHPSDAVPEASEASPP